MPLQTGVSLPNAGEGLLGWKRSLLGLQRSLLAAPIAPAQVRGALLAGGSCPVQHHSVSGQLPRSARGFTQQEAIKEMIVCKIIFFQGKKTSSVFSPTGSGNEIMGLNAYQRFGNVLISFFKT